MSTPMIVLRPSELLRAKSHMECVWDFLTSTAPGREDHAYSETYRLRRYSVTVTMSPDGKTIETSEA